MLTKGGHTLLLPLPHPSFPLWSVKSAAQRQFIDCIETGYVPHINRTYLADWLTDCLPAIRLPFLPPFSLPSLLPCGIHFLPLKGDSSQVEEKLHAVSRASSKINVSVRVCGASRQTKHPSYPSPPSLPVSLDCTPCTLWHLNSKQILLNVPVACISKWCMRVRYLINFIRSPTRTSSISLCADLSLFLSLSLTLSLILCSCFPSSTTSPATAAVGSLIKRLTDCLALPFGSD